MGFFLLKFERDKKEIAELVFHDFRVERPHNMGIGHCYSVQVSVSARAP